MNPNNNTTPYVIYMFPIDLSSISRFGVSQPEVTRTALWDKGQRSLEDDCAANHMHCLSKPIYKLINQLNQAHQN